MPKGSSPTKNMEARYDRMVSQNDKAFRARHRIQRKLIAETKGEDAARDYLEKERNKQRVVTETEYNRTKKIRKFEKSLLRRANKS